MRIKHVISTRSLMHLLPTPILPLHPFLAVLVKLSIIIIAPCFKGYCQGIVANNEKYWIYRERLEATFIRIGSGQGMSIPAELYDAEYDCPKLPWVGCGAKVLAWSDASAHLGYYIAMLATERRVLELSGDPTNQTDQELYYALNALWRLDATSGYYGYDSILYSSGTCFTANSTIPIMDGANYNNANLLDGFFMRDDVPQDFVQNWPDIDAVSSNLIAPNSHECRGKEMSQDQVFAILYGLLCVKEFVPSTLQVNGVPMREFAVFEAGRILDWCKGNGDWVTRNPHISQNPKVIAGETGFGFPPGEVYAGIRFDGVNRTNILSVLENPFWQAFQFPFYLLGNAKYNNEPMIANLAAVGNSWGPCPFLLAPGPQYGACLYVKWGPTVEETREGLDRYAARAKEAQYLLHHLVYNSDWSNSQNISESSMLDMLDSAPCEGPYSPWPNAGIYGWTTANRFWVPRRSADGTSDNLLYGKKNHIGQKYNGIDYMLLHNLYYLWRHHNGRGDTWEFPYENLSHTVIDHDWPMEHHFLPIYNGSHHFPIEVRSLHTISTDAKVKVIPNRPPNYLWNGDVTYRAGDWIDMTDGFEVELGADFEAYIDPIECINGLIQRENGQLSKEEQRIKDIYDAAELEDKILHAHLLDSLGMTEEEYAAYWQSMEQMVLDPFHLASTRQASLSGIDEGTATFLVFPNPTNRIAQLRAFLPSLDVLDIQLNGLDGKFLGRVFDNTTFDAGEHILEINLEPYPAGIYMLCVKHKGGVERFSIVKME